MAEATAEKSRTGKVDLNKASHGELVALPGIGAAAADAIVKYREEHGRFKGVDDLVNVSGIGDATLQHLRAHVAAPGERKGHASRRSEDQGSGRNESAGSDENERGGATRRAGERQAETARRAGEATRIEARRRAGENVAETTRWTPRARTDVARAETERGTEMARRVTGTTAEGSEELFTFGRNGVAGVVGASQAVLNSTSELGNVWLSFWTEQLSESMKAMRQLAECRSWHEALEIQAAFTRTSFERVWSRASKSAELTTQVRRTAS
jgi:competence ComEA-like helix-hairpin-helix protein